MRVVLLLCLVSPIALAVVAQLGGAAPSPPVVEAPKVLADPSVVAPTESLRVARLLERVNRVRSEGERPRVIPRATWDSALTAAKGLHAYPGDLARRFTHVVVHHSDFDPAGGPDGILRYHLEVSGFADIGYHFVVEPDGRIYEGRDLRYVGAHAGYTREQRRLGITKDPDYGAIGVVLDGYFEDARPNERQLRAAFALVEDLRRRFGIPREHVIGHGEVAAVLVEKRALTLGSSPTTCPGSALLEVRAYRALDDAPAG